MINTDTLAVTKLRAADVRDAQLSLSADGSTLLYTVPLESAVKEYRIDLDTLQVLPGITIPAHHTAVLEGLNNQAYVANKTSILQFDATTGALEKTFYEHPPLSDPPYLAISPDRQYLYAWTESASATVYDISGATPLNVGSLSVDSPVFSPDGRYVYYDSQSSYYIVYQAPLPDGTPSKKVFPFNFDITRGLTSVGLDGRIFQSFLPKAGVTDKSGSIEVYDPDTLEELFNIQLGALQQGDLAPYLPLQTMTDRSGKYFFTEIQEENNASLWIFAPELVTQPPLAHPTKNLLNVSTRTLVGAGEDAMIGGFIIQGPKPKKVLIRGLGPSVPNTGAMLDPHLDLYDSTGRVLASNDNWISDRENVVGTSLPPSSERESAIVTTLPPGAYTAVLRDAGGHSGLALVEIYDLVPEDSFLANISTRGTVKSGDNVMIGGFIIGGADPTRVLVRAIGPSLAAQVISEPLADPVLELHNGNGALISTNDDWRSGREADIAATGIAPTKDKESAILATLSPGNYTAIVHGQNDGTGVALVEIYNLDAASSSGN